MIVKTERARTNPTLPALATICRGAALEQMSNQFNRNIYEEYCDYNCNSPINLSFKQAIITFLSSPKIGRFCKVMIDKVVGWWRNNNPFRGLSWQVIVLVVVGAALLTIGIDALISLLPISDELKWRILFGLGIGSMIIGYFLLTRANPRTKQKPPATIIPTTHCGDSCNRSDNIGRKSFHIPNIPRKAFITSNAPTTHKIAPTSWLVRLDILSHFYRHLILKGGK